MYYKISSILEEKHGWIKCRGNIIVFYFLFQALGTIFDFSGYTIPYSILDLHKQLLVLRASFQILITVLATYLGKKNQSLNNHIGPLYGAGIGLV